MNQENINNLIEDLLNSGSGIGDGHNTNPKILTETDIEEVDYIIDDEQDIINTDSRTSIDDKDPTILEKLSKTLKSIGSQFLDDFTDIWSDGYQFDPVTDTVAAGLVTFRDSVLGVFNAGIDGLDGSKIRDSVIGNALITVLGNITRSLGDYVDGVTETTFGSKMEASWYGNSSRSFLPAFADDKLSYKITINETTPLDAGSARSSIYGNLMLGAPFLFNNNTDPGNRTLIDTLIKDSRFLSLTPGMPKFNGGASVQRITDSILEQTRDPNEMMSYLLRSGIDSDKDKRYYTFDTKFEEYYAYLETMLNTIYIKLGLGSEGDNNFNMFSFFDIRNSDGTINPEKYKDLKTNYKSSIGFFVDGTSSVSEMVGNQQTGIGSDLSSQVNSRSETFQKINYVTGMGTGGNVRSLARTAGIGVQFVEDMREDIGRTFTATRKVLGSGLPLLLRIPAMAAAAAFDITKSAATEDLNQIIQSYASTNGMKVIYPELWNDASYSKNLNFDITFTSPYGDPASIFKYVYVPFMSLMAFALPRQAAENGFVSPFFVRADIPGLITSDLAIISDLSWVKGGDGNLWTKDGLPRSIRCSLTITDLYPYLSMTKRLSYLSANPSYTSFLDNMSGLIVLKDETSSDPLNEYWGQMLNRISGAGSDIVSSGTGKLWNRYNKNKYKINKYMTGKPRKSITQGLDLVGVPWVDKA